MTDIIEVTVDRNDLEQLSIYLDGAFEELDNPIGELNPISICRELREAFTLLDRIIAEVQDENEGKDE